MKTISIVTACFNEQENVEDLYLLVRSIMSKIGRYPYEHLFIDNSSSDNTVSILKRLAAADPNVKIIVNARNFGWLRSPTHGLISARGDAIISIVADFQDPPELIPTFIEAWEAGAFAVLGIKRSSEEHSLMFFIRRQYYSLVERLSNVETYQNFTGFGLYDRRVMDQVRSFGDPYPFFRGMIAEIGFPHKKILYDQPQRKRGINSSNWYSLYDVGILGIINHSRVPLRLATFAGFAGAAVSFFVASVYLLLKLIFWNTFNFGLAPLLIGVFFTASLQLVFLGILGEYVGAIYTQVQKRPYVVELERVNFDSPPAFPLPLP
jgi:glycosyltransferase involved in cell wall biosynthesis